LAAMVSPSSFQVVTLLCATSLLLTHIYQRNTLYGQQSSETSIFLLLFAGATTACAWCGSTDSRTGSEGMWQSITTAQNLILEE